MMCTFEKAMPIAEKPEPEKLFRECTTYPEALKTFFVLIDGKSEKDVALIRAEFDKIIPDIMEKEIDESNQLTSYTI